MKNLTNKNISDKQELIIKDIKKQCLSAFEKAYENNLLNKDIRAILLSAKQEAIINNELKTLGLLEETTNIISSKDLIEATNEVSKTIINAYDEEDEEIKSKAIEYLENIRSDRMLVATTNPDMLADDIFKIYQKNEFLKEYVTASILNGLVRNSEKSSQNLDVVESDYALYKDKETNAIVLLSRDVIQAESNANRFTALTAEEYVEVEALDNIDYELGWKEQLKIEHKKDMFPVVYMDFEERADELNNFVRNLPIDIDDIDNSYIIQPETKAQEPVIKQDEVDSEDYELSHNPVSNKTYTLNTSDIVAFIKDEEQLTFPYPQGFLNKSNLRVLRLDLMDLPLSELKELLTKMRDKNEKLEEKQKLELISSLTAELTSNAGVENIEDKALPNNNDNENKENDNQQKEITHTEDNLNKLRGIYDDSKEELEALSKRIDDTASFNPGNDYELSDEDRAFMAELENEEQYQEQEDKRREEERRREESFNQRKKSAHNVK